MRKRTLVAALTLVLGLAVLAAAPLGGTLIPGPAPMPQPASIHVNAESAKASAAPIAQAFVADFQARQGLSAPGLAFAVEGVEVDPFGGSHVRFQETYEGVPVFNSGLIAHVNNAAGGVFAMTARAQLVPAMDTTPSFGARRARRIAKDAFVSVAGPGKTRSNTVLGILPGEAGYDLAYRVIVSNVLDDNFEPAEWLYFIDAHTGAVLDSWNNLHTKKGGNGGGGGKPGGGGGVSYTVAVTGTGDTLYSGSVSMGTAQASDGSSNYAMKDLGRGDMYTTDMNDRQHGNGSMFTSSSNTWGDGTEGDRATVGADAHFGAEMTWDYYLNTYGRNGIFNDGKGPLSRVHYGRRYNNAYWSDSCKCMTYGDGDGSVLSPLTSLDVAGHEMSHGVTSATSNLNYSGESGGLNEAYSDIMGTGVEYYAATHGANKNWNYLIGEDVYTPHTNGDALRYMDDPTKDGYSIDHYSQYYNGLDVHYSSGLWNNAFYLLAHGGRNKTSGISVSGIGIDKALAICYLANTAYFSSSESFSQAKADCIAAAAQLYGSNSTEAARTADAWTACGVN